MATGDLEGNLERLKAQLRSIGYPHAVDHQGLKMGLPSAILPLLHHALLGYSRHVARYLSTNGYELYAKSDLRFIECILKFLRTEFAYRCPLTIAQIFSRGFSERKMLFVHDVVQCCKRKHNELLKESRRTHPSRKARSDCESIRSGRYIGISRNDHASRDEDYDVPPSITVKSYKTSSPKSYHEHKHSSRTKERQSRVSVELSPDSRSHHVTSENCNHSPESSSLRSQLDGEECTAKTRRHSHSFTIPVHSSPLTMVCVENENSHLNADTRIIDSSLPRKLDAPVNGSLDASLPRRIDTQTRMESPPRMSPEKIGASPVRVSPKEDSKESPHRTPKSAPTWNQESIIPKNVAAITLCYDEIKQKIGEIADKLESRFGTLERSLAKTAQQLEARFGTLETRVSLLEKTFSSQIPHSPEPNIHYCKKHSPKHEHFHYSKRYEEPTDVHAIRDISNTQQNYSELSPALRTAYRANLTTQELIDSIKARCNKTKELLNGIY